MLRYLTAGESHGRALIAIIEGVPSNLSISRDCINVDLARRQKGYGRGGRMKIESDSVQLISGIRLGKTIGSPIALLIDNRDWENWNEVMNPDGLDLSSASAKSRYMPVTRPRPGHADLSGAIKYNQRDIRNVLERSSARETAARTAVGAVARRILNEFGIQVCSWVCTIGCDETEDSAKCESIYYKNIVGEKISVAEIYQEAEKSEVRTPDRDLSKKFKARIDAAKAAGDTLGGIFEVVVTGIPVGLGSHAQWDRKLDMRLAGALMSVQAIKGVEVGIGFKAGSQKGSEVHDEIEYADGKYRRIANNAGGIEGGMSNGEDIVLRAVMKPIPTLYKPLKSVDIVTKTPVEASIERSDVCAVPAAAVIGEAVVAVEIASAMIEKFGGDSIEEMRKNIDAYGRYVEDF